MSVYFVVAATCALMIRMIVSDVRFDVIVIDFCSICANVILLYWIYE